MKSLFTSALGRFRLMAIVAGIWSLLLWFVYMPAKYLFGIHSLIFIPIVHGYIYIVYVLAALQYGFSRRWELIRIIRVVLAGTLPVASFIAERRVVAEDSQRS